MNRHVLLDDDLSPAAVTAILQDAARRKAEWATSRTPARLPLAGRYVGLLFEKRSTRTRVSFEVATVALGGHPVLMQAADLQLANGESVEDTARTLSCYCDLLVLRARRHETLVRFAGAATVPVINAMTDLGHPCQALADLLTIQECTGGLLRHRLAYLGDPTNVANSLMLSGVAAGLHVRVATPPQRPPNPAVVERARRLAHRTGGQLLLTADPVEAVAGAHALYADVWATMLPGDEHEQAERRRVFGDYAITPSLLSHAREDAVVMHCMPARPDEEIAAEILDGPRAVLMRQAANRLHTQVSLMALLLDGALVATPDGLAPREVDSDRDRQRPAVHDALAPA